MSKPPKLKDFSGKFPDEEVIQRTYKLEPQMTPEEEALDKEKRRQYALNVAMSRVALNVWDAWISHLVEYNFWQPAHQMEWGHYCLFCQVTGQDCYLCSGKNIPIACARHDNEGSPSYASPGVTRYNKMIEVGLEKIQAHADWLDLGRNNNGNSKT